MRIVLLVLVGWLFAALLGPLWRLVPARVPAPDVALLLAVYLGVTARRGLAGPVAGGVAIGWIAAICSGAPAALGALVAGLLVLVARAATLRLLVGGGAFVAALAGAAAVAATLLGLAARLAWDAPIGRAGDEAAHAVTLALVCGIVAPLWFKFCRGLDARLDRRARDTARAGFGR